MLLANSIFALSDIGWGGGGRDKGGEGGGGVAGWRGVVAGWRVRRVKEADRGVVETREVKRKQRGRLLGCNLEE